jgi:hypothetical protein
MSRQRNTSSPLPQQIEPLRKLANRISELNAEPIRSLAGFEIEYSLSLIANGISKLPAALQKSFLAEVPGEVANLLINWQARHPSFSITHTADTVPEPTAASTQATIPPDHFNYPDQSPSPVAPVVAVGDDWEDVAMSFLAPPSTPPTGTSEYAPLHFIVSDSEVDDVEMENPTSLPATDVSPPISQPQIGGLFTPSPTLPALEPTLKNESQPSSLRRRPQR